MWVAFGHGWYHTVLYAGADLGHGCLSGMTAYFYDTVAAQIDHISLKQFMPAVKITRKTIHIPGPHIGTQHVSRPPALHVRRLKD